MAPGQPPAIASKCNVLSGVLHEPFVAADLSIAYTINIRKLNPIYSGKRRGVTVPSKTDMPTIIRNKAALSF